MKYYSQNVNLVTGVTFVTKHVESVLTGNVTAIQDIVLMVNVKLTGVVICVI